MKIFSTRTQILYIIIIIIIITFLPNIGFIKQWCSKIRSLKGLKVYMRIYLNIIEVLKFILQIMQAKISIVK